MKNKTYFKMLLLVLFAALILMPHAAHAAGGDVSIDLTNFPDSTFCSYVYNNFDKDKSGSLSPSEIAAATSINVSDMGITDLAGVEYFTSLTRLNCYKNQLTTLNLSQNTALTYLSCEENQLTALDLSKNTELVNVYCYDNKLASLNVSKCSKLRTLACGYNGLTSLDLSGCTALENLYCESTALKALDVNGHSALFNLNLQDNATLAELYCSNCDLSALDVSGCTALQMLFCYKNQLTILDLSDNKALTELSCWSNLLPTLDVSSNTKLKYLYCGQNGLSSLDLTKNTDLEVLSCPFNDLTDLYIAKCTKLEALECYGNKIASLEIDKCPCLVKAYDEGLDYEDEYNGAIIMGFEHDPSGVNYYLRVDKGTAVWSDLKTAAVTGISLDLKGKISVQFKVKVESDVAYAELRYEDQNGKYSETPIRVNINSSSPDYLASEGVVLVKYSEITSREMNLHVRLSVYDKDGRPMYIYRTTNDKTYTSGNPLEFCAADWANTVIEKFGANKSDVNSWLAMTLLNFGGAAQNYFRDQDHYNYSTYVNPKGYMASEMGSFVPDSKNDLSLSDPSAKPKWYKSMSLDIAADTTLKLNFTGNYPMTVNGNTGTLVKTGDLYVLNITGLRCVDLDRINVVKFQPQTGTSVELKASALSWCNAIIAADLKVALPLAKAICLYNEAAHAAFDK